MRELSIIRGVAVNVHDLSGNNTSGFTSVETGSIVKSGFDTYFISEKFHEGNLDGTGIYKVYSDFENEDVLKSFRKDADQSCKTLTVWCEDWKEGVTEKQAIIDFL